MEVKQYEIVLVNLDPTVGSEIQKTRPCVIISPDELNRNLRAIIIAPMTTKLNNYPTRVKVVHNKIEGRVVIDQIRTVDKSRIIKTLGRLSGREIRVVKNIMRQTFVD